MRRLRIFSRYKPTHIAAAVLVALGLIQWVPYGRDHTNPPVQQEPAWDNDATRALAVRACYDCHSNTTTWPWYASIAPVSWFVTHHVDEARSKVNFSEWHLPQKDADELVDVIDEREMPLRSYTWMHAQAHLTTEERRILRQGLQALVAQSPPKAK